MNAAADTKAPQPAPWTRFLGDFTRAPEPSRALRAATLIAVVAAASAVVANDVGGAFLWVMVFGVIPAGAVVSYLRRHRIGPALPLMLTLITLALVVRFISVNGDPTSPGELRVPLAELLVMLEGVRSFALRSRRELRFALVSSLALIAVAGALSLSMSFAGFAAVWGGAAVLALTLAYRSELRELSRPVSHSRSPSRPQLPVKAIAAAAVTVAVVASAVFLVVPAAKSSRFLAFTSRLPNPLPVPNPGGLSNPSLGRDNPSNPGTSVQGDARESFGYFGFSNRLDTSVRGRPDDTLVLRVRSSAPDFWRGQTFDVWDGRVWSLSDERTAVVGGQQPIRLLQPPSEPPVAGEELIQTVSIEVPGPNLIFAASQATQVYIPQASVFQTTDGSVRTGVELDQGAIYTVVSRRSHATAERLRATGTAAETLTPTEILRRYAGEPVLTDRVRQLAEDLTRDQRTTYDKVRAIERWMGDNTEYSLDIPPLAPGEDAIDRFLFVDKTGFCEQIGSSLVVMLRSQGIPARLAVGYTPGERNPFTGLYEVRARDAHAWAEVYFPGYGWQSFDPTAQVPFAGEPPTDAARVGLRDYLANHMPSKLVLAILGAVGLLIAGASLWRPIIELLRRRRIVPTWASVQLRRIEKIGDDLGRARLEHETQAEYLSALRRTVLRDDRLAEVATALDVDAFAEITLSSDERRRVEDLIGALAPD